MSTMSSTWLHIATKRSKNLNQLSKKIDSNVRYRGNMTAHNLLPPSSISICMVPLLLKVLRLRIIRAR